MDSPYDPEVGKVVGQRKKILIFLIVAFVAFGADLYFKWWAGSLFDATNCPYPECSISILNNETSCLAIGDSNRAMMDLRKEVIPNIFYIHLLNNTGAAWSFLSGQNTLFVLFNIVFLIVAFYFMLTPRKWNLLIVLSFSMIIGGAMGNFYDRLAHGSVRDFLSFLIPLPGGGIYHYPVFNVADICICVGAILYIMDQMVLIRFRKGKVASQPLKAVENGNQ